ncbi:hypothetical protein ACNKHV_16125 [Shigella flexneri]
MSSPLFECKSATVSLKRDNLKINLLDNIKINELSVARKRHGKPPIVVYLQTQKSSRSWELMIVVGAYAASGLQNQWLTTHP